MIRRSGWLVALLLVAGRGACGAAPAVIDGHASFPEGPLWSNGRLLYVEYGAGRVREWKQGRLRTVWSSKSCGPSGLFEHAGTLLVACYDSNSIVALDPVSGRLLSSRDRDAAGRPFTGPNDFTTDGAGGLYFSASGNADSSGTIAGSILHLDAGGVLTVAAANVHYANGLVLSEDGRSLLVADTVAAEILQFPVHPDKSLGAPAVWLKFADLEDPGSRTPPASAGVATKVAGPDGLKRAADGNVYAAQNGTGRVLVLSPDKRLLRSIDVPAPYVTNFDFAEQGGLFVTAAFAIDHPPFPGAVYWLR